MGIERSYIHIIKAIDDKPTTNIQWAKQGCPLSPLLFNTVLEILATAIRQENTGVQTGKEEGKLSLSVVDMILYTENPKDST